MSSIGVIESFFICLGGLIGSMLCHHYKLGVGIYVIMGILLGPSVFNIVSLSYLSNTLSAIGILFVLFEIGLHLSYEKILTLKKFLGNSILSIFLSITTINLGLYFMKISYEILLISMLICISSTPVVYELLTSTKKMYTKVGRFVFTMIILQDILSIILLINHHNKNSFFFTIVSTVIILGFLILVGTKVINKLFKKLSDSFAFILFASFLIIVGLSILTEYIGLSLELGAVLAGFLLAETDYKDYIESQVMIIKDVLLAVFFMTIGMHLPTGFFLENWIKVILLLITVLFCKFVGIFIGARLYLLNNIQSITASIMLLSIGEPVFIFVSKIFPKYVPENISNYILLITVFSIILAPLIFQLYYYFYNHKIDKSIDHNSKFIIIGCNDVTEIIMDIFQQNDISYLCLDNDLNRVNTYKNKGYKISITDYKDNKLLIKTIRESQGVFFSYLPPQHLINQVKSICKNKKLYIKVKDTKEEEFFNQMNIKTIRIDVYDEAYKVCNEILPDLGIEEEVLEKIYNQLYN